MLLYSHHTGRAAANTGRQTRSTRPLRSGFRRREPLGTHEIIPRGVDPGVRVHLRFGVHDDTLAGWPAEATPRSVEPAVLVSASRTARATSTRKASPNPSSPRPAETTCTSMVRSSSPRCGPPGSALEKSCQRTCSSRSGRHRSRWLSPPLLGFRLSDHFSEVGSKR